MLMPYVSHFYSKAISIKKIMPTGLLESNIEIVSIAEVVSYQCYDSSYAFG